MENEDFKKDKHVLGVNLKDDKEVMALVESAATRDQWMRFFYTTDPTYASLFDLGKSRQLSDAECYKLIIGVIIGYKFRNKAE